MSLPVHAVVGLLILGCCPTGMLAPILAVLQQAHVELALVLSFLESAMAFGRYSLHILVILYSDHCIASLQVLSR